MAKIFTIVPHYYSPLSILNLLARELSDFVKRGRSLLMFGLQEIYVHRGKYLAGFAGLILLTILLLPRDADWQQTLPLPPTATVMAVARWVSHWGDFPTGILLSMFCLWLWGCWKKKAAWKNLACACLLASSLAGLSVNVLRIGLGRPRPSADYGDAVRRLQQEPKPFLAIGPVIPGKLQDGFYGWQKPAMFHSFPSGHSATAWAASTALFISHPATAVPALAFSLSVNWSRRQLNRHYTSDLVLGSGIGILVGVAFGRVLAVSHKIPN